MWRVTITEVVDGESEVTRFEQTVDDLNLKAIILAINDHPAIPRVRAPRSDKGISKKREAVATVPNDPFE